MTAATTDRNTKSRDGKDFGLPVAAATKIFAGTIAAINAGGYATKGATSTTLAAVGIAQETVDNSAGANGDVTIKVARGCYRLANSASADAITLADVGNDCYIVDDQTVAKTDGTSTRSIAGKVRDVDADGVWVEF
jgi:hypothetical protein